MGNGADRIAHASDCAVHNAPALPIGPCDCGAEERVMAELRAALAARDEAGALAAAAGLAMEGFRQQKIAAEAALTAAREALKRGKHYLDGIAQSSAVPDWARRNADLGSKEIDKALASGKGEG